MLVYDFFTWFIQDSYHGFVWSAVDGCQEQLEFPDQEKQTDLQHRKWI